MPRGRPRVYPWDEWLNGARHVLRSDVDFRCAVRSMRQQVITEARKREVVVTTQIKVNPYGDGVDWLLIAPPAPTKPPPRDWDAVFAELPRRLVRGVDFTHTLDSMQTMVLQAARRRGLAVTTKTAREYQKSDDVIETLWLYAASDDAVTGMASPTEESTDGTR